MRPSPQQLASIARSIVDALVRSDQIEIAGSHDAAITSVADRLEAYFKAAAVLEADAEKLADDTLRAQGRAGAGLDRRRIVQMIQQKLAKERGFPI